jgi:DnaJ-class molecular chaperone
MINEEEEKFFETNFPGRKKNYYKVLGINKDASLEEITNAYRKLSLKYHPKTNPNNEEAARKFVEINEAFQTLSNQVNRSTYDTLTFG